MRPYRCKLPDRSFSVQTTDGGALVRIGGVERAVVGNVEEIWAAAYRMARWPAHVAFGVLGGDEP